MDGRATHMVLATAALSAFALLLAGPAAAYVPEGDGVHAVGTQSQVRQQAQSGGPGTIPYLSHGVGVDKSLFRGQQSRSLAAPASSASVALDPAIKTAVESRSGDSAIVTTPTIPYLSHGVGVDESLFAGRASRVDARHAALQGNRETTTVSSGSTAQLPHGLRGLSPIVGTAQMSGRQSLGLSGDSALTRVSAPEPEGLTGDSPATRFPEKVSTPSVSGGSDIDWESFGFGAGMVALLGAGIGGLLLTTRRRHTVGLP